MVCLACWQLDLKHFTECIRNSFIRTITKELVRRSANQKAARQAPFGLCPTLDTGSRFGRCYQRVQKIHRGSRPLAETACGSNRTRILSWSVASRMQSTFLRLSVGIAIGDFCSEIPEPFHQQNRWQFTDVNNVLSTPHNLISPASSMKRVCIPYSRGPSTSRRTMVR